MQYYVFEKACHESWKIDYCKFCNKLYVQGVKRTMKKLMENGNEVKTWADTMDTEKRTV